MNAIVQPNKFHRNRTEIVFKNAAEPRPRRQSRVLNSSDLFDGLKEIEIEHHGAVYRLKITRQGKLILNK
ncbi:hemin uptake protein HemP [Nitratireductor basaltis]|uniref:Hemin uptake protein hemP n=1 Tax=Nitratireductor basaltis TaxID=472175 RepID=A0A084UA34_9HYPH|nr:hemin uptake protein HemP [Nitratireductor basaltis]KFB09820.1 Hemin uptake protein hemP [Nitratireductor basaltis]